jgi:hypothetical protein
VSVQIPPDYEERVYAGVLGKLVGVYLGRPVEGWSPQRIASELGTITGYVHDRVGLPLVVTDDDISGTFTFFRALEDAGYDPGLDAERIGRAWLNYLIEGRTVLWWGGLGHSTEHTAYLRLKAGIAAPRSGSAELNGQVVSEQIGAQIFIDAWAMACPGDPDRAARFAREAASVSHDGAAIDAAVALAAMEAAAFVEPDLDRVLDAGYARLPRTSVIARLAADLRRLRADEPDWRIARDWLEADYGPARYRGNVHVVPNHGLILLALLWGDDDIGQTLSIVNTAGWDTDCNSGNVGCLMGIRHGLGGFEGAVDWRGPVRDRLYLPTAEGGRAITDAVIEAGRVASAGRRLAGVAPVVAKDGARFHFTYPGSVQGFALHGLAPEVRAAVTNTAQVPGSGPGALRLSFASAEPALRLVTDTFVPPEDRAMPGYPLLASPSLHPGQRLAGRVVRDIESGPVVRAALVIAHDTGHGELAWVAGPQVDVAAGTEADLAWTVPPTGGQPIVKVGLRVEGPGPGTIVLDRLTWAGEPNAWLGKPADGGTAWRRAWVDGVDQWNVYWDEPFRIVQNSGIGLVTQGSLDWRDVHVAAVVTPHQATAVGVVARVGGRRRWYGLQLVAGGVRLVRCLDHVTTLAERGLAWAPYDTYRLELEAVGSHLRGWVDQELVLEADDPSLPGGGVGLVVQEGAVLGDGIEVRPATA